MLSIRTQDRMELFPYNNVTQINLSNEKYSIQTKDGIFWKELGSYSTKERALEVLDEIEDYVRGWKYERVSNGEAEWDVKEYTENVYRMPKEEK